MEPSENIENVETLTEENDVSADEVIEEPSGFLGFVKVIVELILSIIKAIKDAVSSIT